MMIVAVILAVLWALGLLTSTTLGMGAWFHVVLVLAVILFIVDRMQKSKAAG